MPSRLRPSPAPGIPASAPASASASRLARAASLARAATPALVSTLAVALAVSVAVSVSASGTPAHAGPGAGPGASPGSTKDKKQAPELKVTVAQDPDPARAGQKAAVAVTVAPPGGIKLNRYPGITLEVTGTDGLTLASKTAFVGTKEPIEDPEKFGFTTIDPLKLEVTGGKPGAHTLNGTLKYFYCVVASGYCAPAEMKVRIPVRIAG